MPPPPHVVDHLMAMGSMSAEDGRDVAHAELPNSGNEPGFCGPMPGWKPWMWQAPRMWHSVVQLPDLHRNATKIRAENRKLIIEELKESEASSSEEEVIPTARQTMDLPKRLILRTLRTSWIGPHRLMMFGLKRPMEGKKLSEVDKKDEACWYRFIPLPGFWGAQISAKVKDNKVKITAVKASNDEAGNYDRMEAVRIVDLPEDLRLRTLRVARLGPMRICLFALRKKEKAEAEEDAESVVQESVKEAEALDKVDIMDEVQEDEDTDEEWIKTGESSTPDFEMEIDVQGFSPEDISIKLKKRTLQISAHRKDGEQEDSFNKSIPVPDDVLLDTLKCALKEGKIRVRGQRVTTKDDGERALTIEM